MSITLVSLQSKYIVRYISKHKIDWSRKELARRNGPGDQAGITPTPAVKEFLDLLHQRQGRLFTQRQYAGHCFKSWSKWLVEKPQIQRLGVRAKLYRNFYPSMIDALHAWSILSETGLFDICILDSYEDAVGKTDLTLVAGSKKFRIALMGPTRQARIDRNYKLNYRNGEYDNKTVEVAIPFSRPRRPGNKRWFVLKDFEHITQTLYDTQVANAH